MKYNWKPLKVQIMPLAVQPITNKEGNGGPGCKDGPTASSSVMASFIGSGSSCFIYAVLLLGSVPIQIFITRDNLFITHFILANCHQSLATEYGDTVSKQKCTIRYDISGLTTVLFTYSSEFSFLFFYKLIEVVS